MASMSTILGDPDRIRAIAEDFVAHYEDRVEEGTTQKGKAMFVCSSREAAYQLYKDIITCVLNGMRCERVKKVHH